jgi:hypothetical protein
MPQSFRIQGQSFVIVNSLDPLVAIASSATVLLFVVSPPLQPFASLIHCMYGACSGSRGREQFIMQVDALVLASAELLHAVATA